MKPIYRYLIIFLGALLIGYNVASELYKVQLERSQNNVSSLLQGIRYKNDSLVTEIKTLQLTVSDIKQAFPGLKQALKEELNVRLRNAVIVTSTATEHNKTFETFVRDSVKINNRYAEVAQYSDEWVSFNYKRFLPGDTAIVNYSTHDSCFAALEREPWNLFKPFRRRDYYLKMKNYNPNNRITHNQVIQVEKR